MPTAINAAAAPASDPASDHQLQVAGRRTRLPRLIGAGGEALLTVGVILALYIVYEVWISNLFAARHQAHVRQQLAQEWQSGRDPLQGADAVRTDAPPARAQGRLSLPSGIQVVLPPGRGFANIYIPRLGEDYAETIVEGTDAADLAEGPGHYIDTALPGQIGNFAIAGHRVGQGEPFLNLDQLRPGDPIVIQTAHNWFVYHMLGDPSTGDLSARDAQGVPGREIVSPSDGAVIDPVPDEPGRTPTRAMLTLTTCHPKFSSNERMVVHATLARVTPAHGTALPRELSGGSL